LVWPAPHAPAHTPFEQTSPLAHVRPQAPQFIGLVRVSTQVVPQRISLGPHGVPPSIVEPS
jgi:hypothetical protein